MLSWTQNPYASFDDPLKKAAARFDELLDEFETMHISFPLHVSWGLSKLELKPYREKGSPTRTPDEDKLFALLLVERFNTIRSKLAELEPRERLASAKGAARDLVPQALELQRLAEQCNYTHTLVQGHFEVLHADRTWRLSPARLDGADTLRKLIVARDLYFMSATPENLASFIQESHELHKVWLNHYQGLESFEGARATFAELEASENRLELAALLEDA